MSFWFEFKFRNYLCLNFWAHFASDICSFKDSIAYIYFFSSLTNISDSVFYSIFFELLNKLSVSCKRINIYKLHLSRIKMTSLYSCVTNLIL